MKDVEPPLRVAYRKGAKEHFKKAYEKIPENIHVIRTGGYPSAADVVKRYPKDIVLQIPRSMKDIFSDDIPQEDYDEIMALPSGDPNHVSPFTPFVLFHRLGDKMLAAMAQNIFPFNMPLGYVQLIDRFHGAAEALETIVANAREKNTYIVNTAAGRKHALTDPDNIMSDMFAKYMMTGKTDVLNLEAVDSLVQPGAGKVILKMIEPGLRVMRALAPYYH
jgi:hypothetical protein